MHRLFGRTLSKDSVDRPRESPPRESPAARVYAVDERGVRVMDNKITDHNEKSRNSLDKRIQIRNLKFAHAFMDAHPGVRPTLVEYRRWLLTMPDAENSRIHGRWVPVDVTNGYRVVVEEFEKDQPLRIDPTPVRVKNTNLGTGFLAKRSRRRKLRKARGTRR